MIVAYINSYIKWNQRTSKIKTLLLADKKTSGYHVKVVTEQGQVFLMGLINHQQADATVNLIRKIRGVKKVVKLFKYQ